MLYCGLHQAPISGDWTLVSEQDLTTGGPYSSVEFDSLTMDERYLCIAKDLKATAAGKQLEIYMRSGASDYTGGDHYLRGQGARMDDTGLGGGTVPFGTGNIVDPMHYFATDELLDASNAQHAAWRGSDYYLEFFLKDQGTTDNQGVPFSIIVDGGYYNGNEYISNAHSNICYRSGGPATQINGIRWAVTASGSFDDTGSGKISLYRYTGELI